MRGDSVRCIFFHFCTITGGEQTPSPKQAAASKVTTALTEMLLLRPLEKRNKIRQFLQR